jgi:hypothetical protein
LGVLYPILVAVAILTTLTCVNMVIVTLAPSFWRKASSFADLWPAALVGLALTFLEVGLAGLLKYGLIALASRIS